MKIIYMYTIISMLAFFGMMHAKVDDIEISQLIIQSKDQIRWDCAKLIYLVVKNAVEKIAMRPAYATLYQEVKWVFNSVPMEEILQITASFVSRADMYATAACVARQHHDEDVVLVLQIAYEHEREGFFARYRGAILYTLGMVSGYVASYYLPFDKHVLQHLPR